MDYGLLQKSINFHGNEMVEALRSEQGENFTSNLLVDNLQAMPESSYKWDRKQALVSFIAQKADILFKRHRADAPPLRPDLEDKDYYAVMPPLECYLEITDDSMKKHFYQTLKVGDVVIGTVSAKHTRGLIIKLLCVSVGEMRFIHDLNIKCFCNTHQIPLLSAHEDPLEEYHSGDLVQGSVLDVQPENEKIYISMKETSLLAHLQPLIKLGLISDEDLPIHYKESLSLGNKKYEENLESTLGFMNPSIVSHLSSMMGISLKRLESLMRGLHAKEYPKEDYASEIYKVQCSEWAYKSVKQGIRHFKAGSTVEAFQCLNKALQIDPWNVEALVARGALYANNNSFSKAIDDFSKALEFNPHHVNAGKYAVETLVAFGKQHEEKGCTEEAIKCYQKALLLNPNHSEAMYYMKSSQQKSAKQEKERARQLVRDAEAATKKQAVKVEQKVSGTKQKLQQLLNMTKDGKSTLKKRQRSSSSSTSTLETSDSSSSSTNSDSSQSESRSSSNSSTSYCRSRHRSGSDHKYAHKRSRKSAAHHSTSSHNRKRQYSGDEGNDRERKRQKLKSERKKRKRSSDSDESPYVKSDKRRSSSRRKSLSSGPAISPRATVKNVRRRDSRPENSLAVLVDNNSHASSASFKSRSSTMSYGPRILDGNKPVPQSQKQEAGPNPSKIKAGRQSLEELESFLASLKASKNAKQTNLKGNSK